MLTIKIHTDNAAFHDEAWAVPDAAVHHECVRILNVIAVKINHGEREGKAVDINGNVCGTFKLTNR